MYLSDDDLKKYLQEMMEKCTRNGDLAGVLLTGIDKKESLELVQQYVDRTGDVQLACLMMKQIKVCVEQIF
jgi:altronate dehydratase